MVKYGLVRDVSAFESQSSNAFRTFYVLFFEAPCAWSPAPNRASLTATFIVLEKYYGFARILTFFCRQLN